MRLIERPRKREGNKWLGGVIVRMKESRPDGGMYRNLNGRKLLSK